MILDSANELSFFRKEIPIGKIEEVIANLQSGALSVNKKKEKEISDDRTFAEIVDQVMPKEVNFYLKMSFDLPLLILTSKTRQWRSKFLTMYELWNM